MKGRQLSKTMRAELVQVMQAKPDSVFEWDRHPEEWIRMAAKPTVRALQARGLVDFWQYDYPCGGYRAHLTEEGTAARREVRRAR